MASDFQSNLEFCKILVGIHKLARRAGKKSPVPIARSMGAPMSQYQRMMPIEQEWNAKKVAGTSKSNKHGIGKDSLKFVQIICSEYKKVKCTIMKKSKHVNKHHKHQDDRDINSNSNFWSVELDSTGALRVSKRLKTKEKLINTILVKLMHSTLVS